jgi:ThiF family
VFEYSESLDDLLYLLGDIRVANRFLQDIGVIYRLNKRLFQDEGQENLPPTILLLRSPADTGFSGSDLEAHFAAGILAPDDAQLAEKLLYDDSDETAWRQMADDLRDAPIFWAQVYDNRPEVLLRRGTGRPTEKVAGASVLVLGCGALGAQIAEHCVRAGARRVHVVDSDAVSPGVLVRQPYEDADIGQPKAVMLAERLDRIRPETEVSASTADILSLDLPGDQELGSPNLIIDATASRTVATGIERTRRDTPDTWPALVTVGISQTATAGIAAVTPTGFTGAGVDLLRRLALETSQDEELADIHAEFFPPPSERIIFDPEPGCSDATFIGSATDVSALAAQLLDSALTRLNAISARAPTSPPRGSLSASLCIARLGRDGSQKPARAVLDVPPDLLLEDNRKVYQVRLDSRAAERMLNIVTVTTADQGPAGGNHIGGLLLGQFDDVCQIVWVSEVTSPPPGSTVSQIGVELTPEAQEDLEASRKQSRGLLSHIGFWHVYRGSPMPSKMERQTKRQLLGFAPRMLLLVLGLPDRSSTPYAPGLPLAAPDMYAEVITA